MGDSLTYWRQMGGGEAALSCLPFGLMLLSIALLPFVQPAASWWEKNSNKLILSVLLALVGILLCLIPAGDPSRVFQVFLDYGAFMAVVTALYVASGGVHIVGAYEGFPRVNTLYLALGAVLSNFLGTMGASLLLIRPLLHANRHRKNKAHILIFFIFIVSNCASCLVPLGPPLYLGYLRGVPFLWTLHLWPQCGLAVGILLVVFHFIDEWFFEREEVESKGRMSVAIHQSARKIHVQGWINTLFLALVMGVIVFSCYFLQPFLERYGGEAWGETGSKLFQILALGSLAFTSFRSTPRFLHELNRFHFAPLQEVAILFFGIFGSMIPALALLEAKGPALALTRPWQYFWASGLLSAFLDNAPAYLNFTVLAASQNGIAPNHLGELAVRFPRLLAAISCGSSFMGALTYIGNGPNLVVKSIAEYYHVKMPSFGSYLLWSGVILMPLFVLMTLLFF